MRARSGPFARRRDTRLFLLEHLDDRFLVVIHKLRRVEAGFFAFQDMLGELQHVRGNFYVGNLVKIFLRILDFIGIPQRGAHQSLVPRLKHDDALALGQHDTSQSHHSFFTHGFADDRKRILTNLVVRRKVVRAVEVSLVYLFAWNERVDFDCVVALNLDRFEFLVFDKDIGPLGVFVAAPLVLACNRFARYLINKLLPQPIAGLLVYLPK